MSDIKQKGNDMNLQEKRNDTLRHIERLTSLIDAQNKELAWINFQIVDAHREGLGLSIKDFSRKAGFSWRSYYVWRDGGGMREKCFNKAMQVRG